MSAWNKFLMETGFCVEEAERWIKDLVASSNMSPITAEMEEENRLAGLEEKQIRFRKPLTLCN